MLSGAVVVFCVVGFWLFGFYCLVICCVCWLVWVWVMNCGGWLLRLADFVWIVLVALILPAAALLGGVMCAVVWCFIISGWSLVV